MTSAQTNLACERDHRQNRAISYQEFERSAFLSFIDMKNLRHEVVEQLYTVIVAVKYKKINDQAAK